MKKTLISAAILAVASVSSAFAGSHSDKVVVEFGYPYPHLFDVTYEAMMPSSKEKHPNIEIKFLATYETYVMCYSCCTMFITKVPTYKSI